MKKIVIGLFAGICLLSSVSAQTGAVGKFGPDSVNCRKSLSLYQEDFRNKDYVSAIVNWRYVFKNCPQSSINNVPRGIIMYQYFIAKELNPTVKQALVDTLIIVYRTGIEQNQQNLEKKIGYLAAMAGDMIKYMDDKPETQKKILDVMMECMVAGQEKTPPKTFADYMLLILKLNNSGALTDEELMENYTKMSDILGAAIKKTSNEGLAKARDMIDDSFAKSSAANCENLNKIYSEKFEANKNDLDFLRKLTRLLNRNECMDTKLFEQASEQQFSLDPSAGAAYNMAKLFYGKKNFEKALEYFDSAIEHETDIVDKAIYYVQKGHILLSQNKFNDAKKCAIEATKLRPDWGEPYLLLANVYVSGPRCGADEFEKNQIYWVIVDKYNRAKSVDPDYAERVNSLIRSYSVYFPSKEEAFFRGIIEGATVNVECWVNESTKARW